MAPFDITNCVRRPAAAKQVTPTAPRRAVQKAPADDCAVVTPDGRTSAWRGDPAPHLPEEVFHLVLSNAQPCFVPSLPSAAAPLRRLALLLDGFAKTVKETRIRLPLPQPKARAAKLRVATSTAVLGLEATLPSTPHPLAGRGPAPYHAPRA